MTLTAEFKEKLSSFGLDETSTTNVLHSLQVQQLEDVGCFSEEDFVEAGMKLFKARKLMQIYEMSQGVSGKEILRRTKSGEARDYRHSNSFYEHRSDSFKKKLQQQSNPNQPAETPRQPFLGRSSSGGKLQRLSSKEIRTSTAQASFSSEALLLKRSSSTYDPSIAANAAALAASQDQDKKIGRASISQHPMLKQELEAAERLELQQLKEQQKRRREHQLHSVETLRRGTVALAPGQTAAPLSPKAMYLQKVRQQQKKHFEEEERGEDFHGGQGQHVVYEYHNYSSLHPNDRPPPPVALSEPPFRDNGRSKGRNSIMNQRDVGSRLDGQDPESLIDELEVGGRDRRHNRGSMESVVSYQQPQVELNVHEADYCFEEATKAFHQDQFDRAMSLCSKAADIYKQIWKQTPQGKFPPEQGHSCFTLHTELLRRNGNLVMAEKSAKSLVKLEKRFCGDDHLMTADALFILGRMQLEMQKLDHAAYSLGESLRIQIKQEKDHIRTASGFYYLGLVFQVQERYEKAMPCFSESIRIFTKCVGAQTSDTAEALHGMSIVLYKQGKLDKARESFFKTLTTKIAVYGKDHVSTADTLLNASLVLRDLGNLPEALKYATKSYEVLGKVFGGEHERTQEAGEHIDHLHDLMENPIKNPTENLTEKQAVRPDVRPDVSPITRPEAAEEPRPLQARAPRNSIRL